MNFKPKKVNVFLKIKMNKCIDRFFPSYSYHFGNSDVKTYKYDVNVLFV